MSDSKIARDVLDELLWDGSIQSDRINATVADGTVVLTGSVATFYEKWKLYLDHVYEVIATLTMEQLALRAAPSLRSIGQNAAHMIGARIGWFTRFLGEPWDELGSRDRWDRPGAPDQEAAELVHGLDTSFRLMSEALARWSSADMQKTFAQDWRGEHYDLSRSWVIWHLLEHDLHHGGEISLTLGMHGLQAPDI